MANDTITNILIVGVGGQGILLSADILALLLVGKGFDVKQAEIHGMSQRGGSVHSMVRYGRKIASPMISRGDVDYLLAYEELEALRWAPFVKPGGTVIVNKQQIAPAPVALGVAAYPDDPITRLKRNFAKTTVVEANNLAQEAGNVRAANLAMLGALAADLPFDKDLWLKTIAGRVPPKTLEVNQKAFELGWTVANG
jgi:indolepyruvate ferredoxin oxidoreductase beta subunit